VGHRGGLDAVAKTQNLTVFNRIHYAQNGKFYICRPNRNINVIQHVNLSL